MPSTHGSRTHASNQPPKNSPMTGASAARTYRTTTPTRMAALADTPSSAVRTSAGFAPVILLSINQSVRSARCEPSVTRLQLVEHARYGERADQEYAGNEATHVGPVRHAAGGGCVTQA